MKTDRIATDVYGLYFHISGKKLGVTLDPHTVGKKPKTFWVELPPKMLSAVSVAVKGHLDHEEFLNNMSDADKAEYYKEYGGS